MTAQPTRIAALEGIPDVELARLGRSYRVVVEPPGAAFLFREVRTDRGLAADLSVSVGGHHLFRSTVTLTLTGRAQVAKVAAELAGGQIAAWRDATFAAVEAVMAAEEGVGPGIDLRTAETALPHGGLHILRPLWEAGPVLLVAPGEAGKSTLARAAAVSLAGGVGVLPGVDPVGDARPVLYVAVNGHVEVPTSGHEKSPPRRRSQDTDRRPPPRASASRIRKLSPSVTTTVA